MNDKNAIINQIQEALGSDSSREMAEQVFDVLRADERIYFAGDAAGLIIRAGVDLVEAAAEVCDAGGAPVAAPGMR